MAASVATTRTLVTFSVFGLVVFIFSATAQAQPRNAIAPPTPTSTPTSQAYSPAPRMPRYQPTQDAYTVALYHFDSTSGNLTFDHTGARAATLHGNAQLTAGLYGAALKLDGNGSYVRLGNLGALNAGTLEAYVDFSSACTSIVTLMTLFSAGGEFGSPTIGARVSLPESQNNPFLRFDVPTPNGLATASSAINPCRYLVGGEMSGYFGYIQPPPPSYWPYDQWRFHHIATTWGPRGLEFWVDGILHGVGHYNSSLPGLYAYSCNPQSQLSSPLYPLCQIPTIGLIPGAYAGGLPAYSTFLIGCDASGLCFNGRIDEVRISNIQRTFSPIYDPPPTPPVPTTPTRTPTPSGPYPDFSITNITAPITTSEYMTKTISVLVTNIGNQSFNRASQSVTQVGQQAGGRRTRPANLRAGTGSYFFYVDVYVNRPPANVTDAGNCPALGGGTSWSWVYALGVGESVVVPVDCWLAPGTHTFYAQVDMCDDLSGALCNTQWGYVQERNEENNRFPLLSQIRSASPFSFFPAIGRRE